VYRLGFRSAVRNIGDGPLIIEGRGDGQCWAAAACTAMTADQVIEADGGPDARVAGVGQLRFVTSPDHRHWHLLGFERYELRRIGSTDPLVQDRKSGFCLGDRYRVTTRFVPNATPGKLYTSRCGLNNPGLQQIREGISVGYGDAYAPNLEFQDLPLNGLPAARYVLVHRVNVDRQLNELSYDNDAASILLDLRWIAGRPVIRVVATCPDGDTCDSPRATRTLSAHAPVPMVRTVATGLDVPWDIGFMPGGGALVTERPGRVRLLEPGGHLRAAPVADIAVSQRGEGGLLGLAVDPEFGSNAFIYLYFTTVGGMRLERWRWTGSGLVREVTVVDAIKAGTVHDSGRIGFGPDGRLYIATGDAGRKQLAQSQSSLNGKLLALTPDQYRGAGPVRPAIVASGLRNPQGFDWQPGTDALIANDHGPSGFDGPEGYDEVDRIVQGGNYGWPNVVGAAADKARFIAPLLVYLKPIAPSGAAFVKRPGSSWTGVYVIAALRGQELRLLHWRNGRVVGEEPLLHKVFGRLRTVREGPDGCLYVLTSNRDGRGVRHAGDDKILCVIPPAA
jgi:quinoprotein glucose dehydrogenase